MKISTIKKEEGVRFLLILLMLFTFIGCHEPTEFRIVEMNSGKFYIQENILYIEDAIIQSNPRWITPQYIISKNSYDNGFRTLSEAIDALNYHKDSLYKSREAFTVKRVIEDKTPDSANKELTTRWDNKGSYFELDGKKLQLGLRSDGFVVWRYIE